MKPAIRTRPFHGRPATGHVAARRQTAAVLSLPRNPQPQVDPANPSKSKHAAVVRSKVKAGQSKSRYSFDHRPRQNQPNPIMLSQPYRATAVQEMSSSLAIGDLPLAIQIQKYLQIPPSPVKVGFINGLAIGHARTIGNEQFAAIRAGTMLRWDQPRAVVE